ncbi:hypothetical protein niasHS_012947 [Heterodera schachtii]|uniref:UDP-glucuronosyltransferase n=1 Tax=Heterodera schachtii TaxID=97005 RepID=A0ABD2IJJ3_HETSC
MSSFVAEMANTLKILVVQPNYMFLRSHFGFGLNLAKYLAEEGHQIHMLVPITDATYKLTNKNDEAQLNVRYFVQKKTKPLHELIMEGDLSKMNDRIYHEIADDFELMDELRGEKFDVGMAEAFCFTEYSLALFHFLQIAVTISTQSQPMSPFQLYLMGHLSKMKQSEGMPTEFIGISTMNILRNGGNRMKLLNMRSKGQMAEELKWRRDEVWKHCVDQTLAKIKEHINMDTEYQKLAEEKFHLNFPGWDALFAKSRFFFINSLPEIDFVQSKILKGDKRVKFTGGLHFGRPSDIDEKAVKNTNALISRSLGTKEGIVLVSFGTNDAFSGSGDAQFVEAMAGTMDKFPNILFIWKLAQGIEGQFRFKWDNVITQSWINQKELLAHPKTKAFVSHCGMNSLLESVFHGVPIVCVPFIMDQYYNAELMAFRHIGLAVDRENDQQTVQNELISALSEALGRRQRKNNDSATHFDLAKFKAVSAAFRQKNVAKTIADAMKEIEKEIGQ